MEKVQTDSVTRALDLKYVILFFILKKKKNTWVFDLDLTGSLGKFNQSN
jgi:hypothetical protein